MNVSSSTFDVRNKDSLLLIHERLDLNMLLIFLESVYHLVSHFTFLKATKDNEYAFNSSFNRPVRLNMGPNEVPKL